MAYLKVDGIRDYGIQLIVGEDTHALERHTKPLAGDNSSYTAVWNSMARLNRPC